MNDNILVRSGFESVLTAEERQLIDAELAHIPHKKGGAIDALNIVQDRRGWISDECLHAIADYLGMSVADLEGVATTT